MQSFEVMWDWTFL